MNLLLDTHLLLWWLAGHPRLTRRARALLETPATKVYVSVASLWETAIKATLKRITADPLELYEAAIDSGFEVVSIQPMHAIAVNSLPLHHGNPFDRMLIAQARAERLTLLTHDKSLLAYGGDIEVV